MNQATDVAVEASKVEETGMQAVHDAIKRGYEHGFSTDIDTEKFAKGLSEQVVRAISAKKNEPQWLTDWRLQAYRHWLTMTPPDWAKLKIAPIDYQDVSYYAAPKKNLLKSMDEVDPKLLATFDKLGVPLHERARLAGVAVDAVFDSVSVGTTFKNLTKSV
jgi:Fe-S cluster assembly protein SufB